MSITRLLCHVLMKQMVVVICVQWWLCLPICSQVSATGPFLADTSAPATVEKLVQEVDLTFTVTDRHGHPVRALTPADVSVLDNGASPERILYFKSQARLPLRLALVIDKSDSVFGNWEYEKHAAEMFLKHEIHSASDIALVVTFNERARIEQSATSDQRLLSRAIRQVSFGGNTAIFDAVALASRQLGSIPNTTPALKVILLMTDGKDNSSKLSVQEAETTAQENATIVFALNTGLESLRSETAEKNMKVLSEVTGGSYFRADGDQIRDAFVKIGKELRSQYVIGYKPAQTSPDGAFHRISILVPKKLRVRHQQGYFAR